MSPAAEAARRRLIAAGIVATCASLIVLLTTDLANRFILDGRAEMFDASGEGNLPTWMSVVAAFAAALGCLIHAVLASERRGQFAVLAASLAYVSLDELAELHESAERHAIGRMPEPLADAFDVVVLAPVLGAILVVVWIISRHEPSSISLLLRLGLLLLIATILADEVVNNATEAFVTRGVLWPDQVRAALEEAFELAGLGLLATALLARLPFLGVVPGGANAVPVGDAEAGETSPARRTYTS